MSDKDTEIPVPVLNRPHWRVNIRPDAYESERIPSISECLDLVERNRVRFRGWDYPHLSPHENERQYGESWVGSWSSFMGHLEYWRFYQSGQFLHLFSVREVTAEEWRDQLEQNAAFQGIENPALLPGFLDLVNFLYCVTEIVEFTARLAESGLYGSVLSLGIHLKKIKGFALTVPPKRSLRPDYRASMDKVGKQWTLGTGSLLADCEGSSVQILTWFLERFGMRRPPVEVLREDVATFRRGVV